MDCISFLWVSTKICSFVTKLSKSGKMENFQVRTKRFSLESVKVSLESVIKRIFTVGTISPSDRQVLRSAVFSFHCLNLKQQDQLKQVYEELEAGRIRLIQ